MSKAPLDAQIAEVKRELALRATVYPELIARGKMTADEGVRHTRTMEAVLETLHWLKLHRDVIVRLGREAMAIRAAPAIEAALSAFPDATITDIRPMREPAHDHAD